MATFLNEILKKNKETRALIMINNTIILLNIVIEVNKQKKSNNNNNNYLAYVFVHELNKNKVILYSIYIIRRLFIFFLFYIQFM